MQPLSLHPNADGKFGEVPWNIAEASQQDSAAAFSLTTEVD